MTQSKELQAYLKEKEHLKGLPPPKPKKWVSVQWGYDKDTWYTSEYLNERY